MRKMKSTIDPQGKPPNQESGRSTPRQKIFYICHPEATISCAKDCGLKASKVATPQDVYIAQLEAALSEAPLYLPDGNNTESVRVVAWHRVHKETIAKAAAATGRSHLLV